MKQLLMSLKMLPSSTGVVYNANILQVEKDNVNEQQDSQQDSQEDSQEDTQTATKRDGSQPNYDYLLDMGYRSGSFQRRDALLARRDKKAEELHQMRKKPFKELWLDDLDKFMEQLDVSDEYRKHESIVARV